MGLSGKLIPIVKFQSHQCSVSELHYITMVKVKGILPVSTDGFVIVPISRLIELTLEPVMGVVTDIVLDPMLEQLVATDSNLQDNPLLGKVY